MQAQAVADLRAGEISEVRGNFPGAEESFHKALNLLQHSEGADPLPRIQAFDDLGWLYVTWGKMTEGSRLMDEARAAAEHADPDDARLIQHWDTQAAYLLVVGRYSEARNDWAHAIEIGKSNYGPDSPKYANILVHFGQASSAYGDYKTAEELFRRYLTIDGVSDAARAVAEGELAHVYVQLHQYTAARRLFDTSLAVFEKEPGLAPLVRSMILTYSGDWYMDQRDWGQAQLQYREAVNIQQNVLGVNHAVPTTMLSLSKALKKMRHKDEARQWMARAKTILASQKEQFPEDTVDVIGLKRGE